MARSAPVRLNTGRCRALGSGRRLTFGLVRRLGHSAHYVCGRDDLSGVHGEGDGLGAGGPVFLSFGVIPGEDEGRDSSDPFVEWSARTVTSNRLVPSA